MIKLRLNANLGVVKQSCMYCVVDREIIYSLTFHRNNARKTYVACITTVGNVDGHALFIRMDFFRMT